MNDNGMRPIQYRVFNASHELEIKRSIERLALEKIHDAMPAYNYLHSLPVHLVRECNLSYLSQYEQYVRDHPPSSYLSMKDLKVLEDNEKTNWTHHAMEGARRALRAFRLAKVPLILAAGTLLGWVRTCGIIPHTNDVDFYVPHGYITSQEHFMLLVVCVLWCLCYL